MIVQCQNCRWLGDSAEALPADNIEIRHAIGDIYSDLECPKCEALCMPIEAEDAGARKGKLLIDVLQLKYTKDHPDRVMTTWGDKTALGLYRTIKRIIMGGE